MSIPRVVDKRWGKELIYINGDGWENEYTGCNSYCMKAIHINPGQQTSMHYHVKKHETLMVIKGKMTLRYGDNLGDYFEIDLQPGEAWVVPPGFQHQLIANEEEVIIIEASTPDNPLDSIRVSL